MTELEKVNLKNIAMGALQERFSIALEQALDNINDINTEAKKVRKITVVLSLKPNENRDETDYSLEVKNNFPALKGVVGRFYIRKDNRGKMCAFENNPEQYTFNLDNGVYDDDKITDITLEKKKGVK